MSREKKVKILASELEEYKKRVDEIENLKKQLERKHTDWERAVSAFKENKEDMRILNAQISHKDSEIRDHLRKNEQLQRELDIIKKSINDTKEKEEEAQKKLKKLIIKEKDLEKLIKKGRETLDPIIKDYAKFLEMYKHAFYDYVKHVHDDRWKEEQEKFKKFYYHNGGYHSPEQHEKFRLLGLEGELDASNVQNYLKGILKALLRIHEHLKELEKLVSYEITFGEKEKQTDQLIEKYIKKTFKHALELNFHKLVKVDEELAKAFSERTIEEEHIDKANEKIVEICGQIINYAGEIGENFSKKEIQVFFEGFDQFSRNSLRKLRWFFAWFLKRVNKNETIALEISGKEEQDIIKSEEFFNMFLKKETDIINS